MKLALADALSQRGYATLTPVQEAVSDPEIATRDLLVSAQTGSGKTVAFGLAIAPTLLGDADAFDDAAAPLALVIAPTRELALQVKRELAWLYEKAGVRMASCVGGMDMRDERRALARGAHVVVATPGRLRDHIMRGSIDLGDVAAVVLDEADEMLDLGFQEDLEFILTETPDTRRTLLFSATVPPMIAKLAQTYQDDALRITTKAEKEQHADITYQALTVAPRDGENAIINVLRYHEAPSAIIFCNTRAMVARMTSRLSNRGFAVVSLSGELSQSERAHALQAMRDGRARICVVTDVAARGIDLPGLDLVIHAELPNNSETLLHRSGRTGRAGRKGVSCLIVPPSARKKAERLLRFAKVTAEWIGAPSAEDVTARDQDRMMADPAWNDPATEAEAATVAQLLAAFSPEQIATAFLRQRAEKHTAPEELSAAPAERERRPRDAFGPSTWFEISIGREDGAEPRRLLPMLCRAGNLTKEDIGAIRLDRTASYAQIRNDAVDRLLAALGHTMKAEDGVFLTQLAEAPAIAEAPRGGPKGAGKPRFPDRKPRDRGPSKPRASKADSAPIDWDDAPAPRRKKPKPGDKATKPRKPKSDLAERREGAVSEYRPKTKPAGKAPGKGTGGKPKGPPPPKGKPSSKKNRARAAAKLAAAKGGNAPPKRR